MDRRNFISGVAVGGLVVSTPNSAKASGNTISGSLDIVTSGKQISITGGNSLHSPDRALAHVLNDNAYQFGWRVTSHYAGKAEEPYQNNDCGLFEVFNRVHSTSHNRSWAGSFANAYNDIPAGVTDTGERVAVIGWSVSVNFNGYEHAGTLEEQVGIKGVAGFQGDGAFASPRTAVTKKATAVKGLILSDSSGATIMDAKAGEFVCTPNKGNVKNCVAVYASASKGKDSNYSFFGASGRFYNAAKSLFGSLVSQIRAPVSIRVEGNAIEFGHPNPNGYGSTIGATPASGMPFIAFNAEADSRANLFTTRGKRGAVVHSDLSGSIVFSRLEKESDKGQPLVKSGKFNARGNLCLSQNPPASAHHDGETGEIAWDDDFVYVCVAPNKWKRTALSSW